MFELLRGHLLEMNFKQVMLRMDLIRHFDSKWY